MKSVAFSQDSQFLITGSNEKLVKIFDVEYSNGSCVSTFTGHAGNLKRAIFCRDEKNIASIAEDKTLRVWDVLSKTEVQRVELNSIPNSMVSLLE